MITPQNEQPKDNHYFFEVRNKPFIIRFQEKFPELYRKVNNDCKDDYQYLIARCDNPVRDFIWDMLKEKEKQMEEALNNLSFKVLPPFLKNSCKKKIKKMKGYPGTVKKVKLKLKKIK